MWFKRKKDSLPNPFKLFIDILETNDYETMKFWLKGCDKNNGFYLNRDNQTKEQTKRDYVLYLQNHFNLPCFNDWE